MTSLATEFEALRFSAWGVAMLLAWLLWRRWLEYRRYTLTGEAYTPIKVLHPWLLLVGATLTSGMVLTTFTIPIFEDHLVWLGTAKRASALVGLVFLINLEMLFVDRLAYNRMHKWQWCVSWILFAHIVKWGVLWL